jgi:hypothetical protein
MIKHTLLHLTRGKQLTVVAPKPIMAVKFHAQNYKHTTIAYFMLIQILSALVAGGIAFITYGTAAAP